MKDEGESLLLSFKSMYACGYYDVLIWNSCESLFSCSVVGERC